MQYTSFVNVFHGSGNIDLPEARGIAASWHFIKALCGNTHPGALLPFGKYSVCPYSGGYSSGYGTNGVNTHLPAPQIMDKLRLKGFSHFQNSGTGGIGVYYNYAVVTPYIGEQQEFYDISGETAEPGYYAVTLSDSGIHCELTAGRFSALHRYTFPAPGGKIAIDFSNDGLYNGPRMRGVASDIAVSAADSHTLRASVTLQDVRLHFVCRYIGDGALDENHIFRMTDAGIVILSVSISAASMDDALAESAQASFDFDSVRVSASGQWNAALSKIRIESDDAAETELFYSNLYHSLIKPCDWGGGGFLWNGAPFVTDFVTFWDMYKTALPLIFTLYPEVSDHIVQTYEKLGESLGTLPNCFMLARNFNLESKQSRLIAVHMLYDAWIRGVKADWESITKHILRAIFAESNNDFLSGDCERTTHTLDMAENCAAAAEMASACGMHDDADRLRQLSGKWNNGFDPATGLLYEDRTYYEGNYWNYSFRPLRAMEERIALAGGTEKFEALLDRFFGFTDAEDTSARFEGFNNETDMESPYAYAYIGRHDKLCAVLDAADRYMFRCKAGGAGCGAIPGNNDSDGLSSCWIWNSLGIFPVSGQDLMHIARPKFVKAELDLASGKTLTVLRRGTGAYPKSASFNGTVCDKLTVRASEIMLGGTLIIET